MDVCDVIGYSQDSDEQLVMHGRLQPLHVYIVCPYKDEFKHALTAIGHMAI